jgi:hypothetical protein
MDSGTIRSFGTSRTTGMWFDVGMVRRARRIGLLAWALVTVVSAGALLLPACTTSPLPIPTEPSTTTAPSAVPSSSDGRYYMGRKPVHKGATSMQFFVYADTCKGIPDCTLSGLGDLPAHLTVSPADGGAPALQAYLPPDTVRWFAFPPGTYVVEARPVGPGAPPPDVHPCPTTRPIRLVRGVTLEVDFACH